MVRLRNAFADARSSVARDIAARLVSGDVTARAFGALFEAFIQDTVLAGYFLGRGGIAQATEADFVRATTLIDTQLGFWDGFDQALRSGELSDAQVTSRAALYGGAAVHAYEVGRSDAYGFSLPAYPADGSTECKTACRCEVPITESEDGVNWEARWVTSGDDRVCDDCLRYSRQWSPLVIPKGGGA